MQHPVSAIILERSEYGEADRLITIFTEEMGRLRCIAKGVRRTLSSRKAALELFTHARLLVDDKNSLANIYEASIVDSFPGLREDYDRTMAAHHIAEIVLRTTVEKDPNPQIFSLLHETLAHLARALDPRLLVEAFRVKYLGAIGFAPELKRCVVCGKDIEEGAHFFSARAEGLECDACRTPDALLLSVNALKLLRLFLVGEYATISRLRLDPADLIEIRALTKHLIDQHAERELKSTRFLGG